MTKLHGDATGVLNPVFRCVVAEDIGIDLAADKVDGMKCIVTKSGYTAEEDFHNADLVFDFIGDPPEERNFIQCWSSIYNTLGCILCPSVKMVKLCGGLRSAVYVKKQECMQSGRTGMSYSQGTSELLR
ncbi:hypothetical protein TB2_038264 [Malus domestica]